MEPSLATDVDGSAASPYTAASAFDAVATPDVSASPYAAASIYATKAAADAHASPSPSHHGRLRDATNALTTLFGPAELRVPKSQEVVAVEAFFDAKKSAQARRLPPQPALNRILKHVKSTRPSCVDLSEQRLGDDAICEVCTTLLGHGELRELRLSNVAVGATGAGSVAELISLSLRLRRVDLSRNGNIGDEGAIRLARGLRATRSLERLDLDACNVGDPGATALAAALAARRIAPVRHLGLSLSPQIGEEGAVALRDAAAACRLVHTVDLAGAGAPPPLLAAVALALTAEGKEAPTGEQLWSGGVHSAFTLRFAPDLEAEEPPAAAAVA